MSDDSINSKTLPELGSAQNNKDNDTRDVDFVVYCSLFSVMYGVANDKIYYNFSHTFRQYLRDVHVTITKSWCSPKKGSRQRLAQSVPMSDSTVRLATGHRLEVGRVRG